MYFSVYLCILYKTSKKMAHLYNYKYIFLFKTDITLFILLTFCYIFLKIELYYENYFY